MAEVHEITRTAFNQLLVNCRDDRDFSESEWVVVEALVYFGKRVTPRQLHFYRNMQNESQAQMMAAAAERISNYIIQDGDPMTECEVWHIVDDEPRARRVDEGCSIFVRVTVPDLSGYMPGTHPVYDYFIRWDRRFVARKGARFYWAFETLTAWDVDTILGLRTRTNSVIEVLDRETYLIETGQSDAIR